MCNYSDQSYFTKNTVIIYKIYFMPMFENCLKNSWKSESYCCSVVPRFLAIRIL